MAVFLKNRKAVKQGADEAAIYDSQWGHANILCGRAANTVTDTGSCCSFPLLENLVQNPCAWMAVKFGPAPYHINNVVRFEFQGALDVVIRQQRSAGLRCFHSEPSSDPSLQEGRGQGLHCQEVIML